MKTKLSSIILAMGAALSFSSCDSLINDFNHYGIFDPPAPTTVQTGTNAAQTSFTKGTYWQPANYDSNGNAIFGYADGRPVYGYTKQGSLIYQMNHIYGGCRVPSWGHMSSYPYGVLPTSTAPF